MVDKQNTFVVREALLEELFAFYTFGYSPDEEGFSQFRQDFDKYITCRFGSIFADAKYVVIEQSYVETEWKDMIIPYTFLYKCGYSLHDYLWWGRFG